MSTATLQRQANETHAEHEARTGEHHRDALAAVLAAGVAAGYWTAGAVTGQYGAARATVRNPEGLAFTFTAGGWRNEGKLTATLASLDAGALRVTGSDVLRSDEKPDDATVSLDRGADVCAKALHKRVTSEARNVAAGRKVRDALALRVQQRAQLLAQLEKLAALGFTSRTVSPSSYWDADVYGPKGISARVTADGELQVRYGANFDVSDAAAFLALVRG